jgi:hypothetical protein
VKKTKRGPIPDTQREKPQYRITTSPTTTYTRTTKHKRAYLLKERERRRIQRERTKEQNEPTKTITRKLVDQKTKSKTRIPQKKTRHDGIKQTKNPVTNNKNTIQKKGSSTTSLNRNRSQKWTTTKTSNNNTGTRKEEQTGTLRLGNIATMKRLSDRKRKLENEPNVQLKTRKIQNILT